MYTQHFGFSDRPFSIAPDPRFLFLSERHREALAHLVYGLEDEGGFVLLTGEVGTGKTTLLRCLLDRVPERTDVAYVLNPRVDPLELLQTLCDELHIEYDPLRHSIKALVDGINEHLLAANANGRSTVLLIDEAQNLTFDVLEQLRLLTNLETNERKLLRIVLLGQPELLTMLARTDLRQLAQRITARYHLTALKPPETLAYIQHRIGVVGGQPAIISLGAVKALHRAAGGIPRLINVMADRALLGAYAEGARQVSAKHVQQAAREVRGETAAERRTGRTWRRVSMAAGLALLAVVPALALWWYTQQADPASPSPAAVSAIAGSKIDASASPNDDTPAKPSVGLASAAPAATGSTGPDVVAPVTVDTAMDGTAANRPPWPAIAREADPQSLLQAFQALFAAWQAPPPPTGLNACDHARRLGLRCLEANGNWTRLVSYNRPAILELFQADQRAAADGYWISVLGVRGDDVEISVGERHFSVTRSDIDARWRGRFILVWQMPPGYERAISQGATGETVAWLQHLLAGEPVEEIAERLNEPGAREARFDAALLTAVRSFQRNAGLRPDGIAGPQTWMLLNERTGLVPTLRKGASPKTVQQTAASGSVRGLPDPLLTPLAEG